MPLLKPPGRPRSPNSSLLSAQSHDPDASSIRSDQESDSDDDERQARARNSRELLAHDRIVLLEEEEMDNLVIEARQRQRRHHQRSGSSHRRGSNLSLPVPMRLFSMRSDGSRSRSPADRAVIGEESIDYLKAELRQQRRQRRRHKKERLLEKAQDGEDGELMCEMEHGRLKDSSSTGTSDREDNDELDRQGLLHLVDTKTPRRRIHRCQGTLIYALVAAASVALALVAWRLFIKTTMRSGQQSLASNGTALFGPTTIIISLDGFRADFLQRGLTPRLSAFVKEGVSPLYMNPSFPSVTFPNHFTLATGLYPEAHGVVGNSFWDPELEEEFYYTDTNISMQSKWWNGEPFWVTAEKQGVRSAIHMWPGSEAHIGGIEPASVDKYNGNEELADKVSRILEYLDRPGLEDPSVSKSDVRPQLIAAYVPNVDADGHMFGPNSTEMRSTIHKVDKMLDDIFLGLEARNLTKIVNVIVVSDHGMATTDVSRMIQMDDLVDLEKVDHVDGWPLVGLRPKRQADLPELYDGISEIAKTNPNFDVYLRDVNMPARYHFSQNDRIAPLWIVPKTGWAIVTRDEFDIEQAQAKSLVYHPRGLHGYDHEHPLMRAIFIARGPAFPHQPGSRLEPFQNIEVYNILCDSLGLTPAPNNGTLRLPLNPVGIHEEVSATETPPAAPIASYVSTATTAPSPISPESNALGLDTVAVGDISSPIGVDPPEDAGQEQDEDLLESMGDMGDTVQEFWDWAMEKFGKAWSWTAGKAGQAWEKIHEDGAEETEGVEEKLQVRV